jgi:aspartate/methionine/tyrosine aminotransferase
MQELAKILKRWPQLYHLSDEVYEHITFEKAHLSANLFEALHEKTVVGFFFWEKLSHYRVESGLRCCA